MPDSRVHPEVELDRTRPASADAEYIDEAEASELGIQEDNAGQTSKGVAKVVGKGGSKLGGSWAHTSGTTPSSHSVREDESGVRGRQQGEVCPIHLKPIKMPLVSPGSSLTPNPWTRSGRSSMNWRR